jgi:hypothetical protein
VGKLNTKITKEKETSRKMSVFSENLHEQKEGGREKVMGEENTLHFVGFEVLTAASMEMAVFWIVAPCSLVEVY